MLRLVTTTFIIASAVAIQKQQHAISLRASVGRRGFLQALDASSWDIATDAECTHTCGSCHQGISYGCCGCGELAGCGGVCDNGAHYCDCAPQESSASTDDDTVGGEGWPGMCTKNTEEEEEEGCPSIADILKTTFTTVFVEQGTSNLLQAAGLLDCPPEKFNFKKAGQDAANDGATECADSPVVLPGAADDAPAYARQVAVQMYCEGAICAASLSQTPGWTVTTMKQARTMCVAVMNSWIESFTNEECKEEEDEDEAPPPGATGGGPPPPGATGASSSTASSSSSDDESSASSDDESPENDDDDDDGDDTEMEKGDSFPDDDGDGAGDVGGDAVGDGVVEGGAETFFDGALEFLPFLLL